MLPKKSVVYRHPKIKYIDGFALKTLSALMPNIRSDPTVPKKNDNR